MSITLYLIGIPVSFILGRIFWKVAKMDSWGMFFISFGLAFGSWHIVPIWIMMFIIHFFIEKDFDSQPPKWL